VEVKIGVQHAPRELSFESQQTPDEIEKAVTKAMPSGLLQLVDEKGRRIIVPAEKLAYVEIAEAPHRPVGFLPS
jgi:hypothetical protein